MNKDQLEKFLIENGVEEDEAKKLKGKNTLVHVKTYFTYNYLIKLNAFFYLK